MNALQEALDSLGVEYAESGNHHCRPGWIQLKDCPFCGSEGYHLGFNLTSHHFNCWKCGGHYAPKVLKELGVPRATVRSLLDDLKEGGMGTPPAPQSPRGRVVLPKRVGPLLPVHRDYLLDRGFDPDLLAQVWGIGGIGLSTRLAWRIFIPITWRGVVVSWTTRAVGPNVEQRYVSASAQEEAVNHKSLVYGLDLCAHSVVVVEGPTDAWRVGPGAGAVFGTAFSTAQVAKLARFPFRYVCFDSEPTAQERARDLASQLSGFPGVTENVVLDAPDPGSAPLKEIRLLRRLAKL